MHLKKENLEIALSYEAYSKYAENLLLQISDDNTNPMQPYAKVNLKILQDLKQSMHLTDELTESIAATDPVVFLILTEGYCGDSAQVFPLFGKMQELFPGKVDIKVILRDEHVDIADHYFGTKSIPMVICLDKQTLKERFIWGSRPQPAQQIMDNLKIQKATRQEKSTALHSWYAQDKTLTLQSELTQLLKKISI